MRRVGLKGDVIIPGCTVHTTGEIIHRRGLSGLPATAKGEKMSKKMILLVLLGLGRVSASAAGGPAFTETRLNDRVLVLLHAPWAETMTAVDAGPGLVVVDTWGSLKAAEKARRRIESLFHKPVLFVINTHHHWDHTFGNQAFKDAVIVGHRFCAGDMSASYGDPKIRKSKLEESVFLADNASIRKYIQDVEAESAGGGFRLCPPSRAVGDRDTLRIGNLTVLLYHTPGIHTRSNLTVFIPELGVVFGRRDFAGGGPIQLEPGANPSKIARVLESILAAGKPVRYLIPGHGEAIAGPDLKDAIQRLKRMDSR
jgi:glyoxylase-like metal-dependent hydrolase (beta-lactamase superfamily II)